MCNLLKKTRCSSSSPLPVSQGEKLETHSDRERTLNCPRTSALQGLQGNILQTKLPQSLIPRYPSPFFLLQMRPACATSLEHQRASNFSCKHLLEGHSNYDGPLLIQVRYSELWLPRAASPQAWLQPALRYSSTAQIHGTPRKRTVGKYSFCHSKLTCVVVVSEPCSF